ncbi:MAG: diaminopimelate epimerase [Chloroflexi bacterium]|nr:diaminopimelate epimerase [Chloroflexota bacterium]
MHFHKYHALGNDYLVIDEDQLTQALTPALVQQICDRHRGAGSDGILLAGAMQNDVINLRIYNPDGSEAEKSGNGLRIFARYLWDVKRVGDAPFFVQTVGGRVNCQVFENGHQVRVEMGQVSFKCQDIPVALPNVTEVLQQLLHIDDLTLTFSAATIGNPHCVIFVDQFDQLDPVVKNICNIHTFGPRIEHHSLFPRRTNVQFAKVLGRNRLSIDIWERGAGYTLASGSSSCAAAAVAHRLGYCDADLVVVMPGGELHIEISPDNHIRMTGPVTYVGEIWLAAEALTVFSVSPHCITSIEQIPKKTKS